MAKKETKTMKKRKGSLGSKAKVISESKNSESAAKKLTKKETQNQQVMWALVLMACLFLIIFLTPYILKNVINKFDHIGLDFYKTKAGDLRFYTTKIPLLNNQGFPIGDYQISFRNDPRELESIETAIPDNIVEFEKDFPVYISIPYDVPICDDNIIAIVGMTNFLDRFGTLNIKSGMHDITDSEIEIETVTCDTHPDNTVLFLKIGNETLLKRINKNCYEIQYKDCEINMATEKFILTIMEKYMERYHNLDVRN